MLRMFSRVVWGIVVLWFWWILVRWFCVAIVWFLGGFCGLVVCVVFGCRGWLRVACRSSCWRVVGCLVGCGFFGLVHDGVLGFWNSGLQTLCVVII